MKQGVTKDIELKGICRAMSRGTGIDGVTDDLVNMRKENGSWKPMSDLTPVYPTDGSTLPYSRLWVHVGPDYRHVFGVLNDELFWFANIDENGEWQPVKEVKLCSIDAEALCHSNGNLVTVGGNTFLLWQQGNNTYTLYDYDQNGKQDADTLVPDGLVDFRVVKEDYVNGAMKVVYSRGTVSIPALTGPNRYLPNTSVDDAFLLETKALYAQASRAHEEAGSFHSPFLVTYAYKTYNGDYVLAGRPKLMYPQSYLYNTNGIDCEGYQPAHVNPCTLIDTDKGYVAWRIKRNDASSSVVYTNEEKLEHSGANSAEMVNYTAYGSTSVLVEGRANAGGVITREAMLDKKYFPTFAICADGKAADNVMIVGARTKLQVKADAMSMSDANIYTKLCVFVTPCVSEYDYSNIVYAQTYEYLGDVRYMISPHRRDKRDVIKDLLKYSFYKIAELDISSFNGQWLDVNIDKGVLINLLQQEPLAADTTKRDGIAARGSYSYNGRLHLFDYDTTQFHGWPLPYFAENRVEGCLLPNSDSALRLHGLTQQELQSNDNWWRAWGAIPVGGSRIIDETTLPTYYIKVEIAREDGTSEVVRYAMPHRAITTLGTDRPISDLNGCLSYPDARAKKMSIWVKQSARSVTMNGSNISIDTSLSAKNYLYVKQHEFSLTPHQRLDIAVYIDPDLRPIQIVNPNPQNNTPPASLSVDLTERNTTTRVANGLRVSAVDNPLYLPAEYSYRVGNTNIVGMMANEVAVGVGQTGDAPLMVFTKDGVYGLFVDSSGELAYDHSRPISSDVCNNAKTIHRVDGGIVFATDRGLMMLKGATATDIGEIAEGDFLDISDTNGMFKFGRCALGAFTAQRICGFVNQQVTGEDFLRYLENAEVGYDHKGKELWAVNAQKDYCYVKDYDGNWRRVTEWISEVVACYPETYVVKNGGVYTLDEAKNKLLASPRRVFVMTRPIEVRSLAPRVRDSQNMKESYRVVARGEFKTDLNTLFGIYVLGSFDGRKWAVIGGRERNGRFVDIGCLTERYDVRYLLVVLAGDIGATGKIDSISVEVRQR